MKTEPVATSIGAIQRFLLAVMCAAWPWEIYQRIPGSDLTLIKVCGALVIVLSIVQMIVVRRWLVPATGLEAAFAVLALAFMLSYTVSVDRGATARMIVLYASYLAFFYAAVSAIRSADDTAWLARVLVGSSCLVAVVTLACSAGWLAPSYMAMARQTGRVVLETQRATAPVRMVATSSDLNQGVVPMLVSIPLALWLAGRRNGPWRRRIVAVGGAALLAAPLIVALSRSSLAAAAVIVLAYIAIEARHHRHVLLAAGAMAVIAVVFALMFQPLLDLLLLRVETAVAGTEASASGRMYGYRIAASLVPQHLFAGTGLDASDAVIHQIADPVLSGGLTLHSVPFKMLLETGVLGLVGYLLLFASILRAGLPLSRSAPGVERHVGRALLVAWGALFLVMAVQPFTVYSPFALLLAMLVGPAAWKDRAQTPPSGASQGSGRWPVGVAALAITAACVLPNMTAFQRTVSHLSELVEQWHAGLDAEGNGRWAAAGDHYLAARDLVRAVGSGPYLAEAEQVAQLPLMIAGLRVARDHPPLDAVAEYLVARVRYAARELDDARRHAHDAVRAAPGFGQAWILMGDITWSTGIYGGAAAAYAEAARADGAVPPARQTPGRALWQARADVCAARTDDPYAQLEGARLAIRLGDRRAAETMVARAHALAPDAAETLFLSGVVAAIAGDVDTAMEGYRAAARALPTHVEAQRGAGQDEAGRPMRRE